MGCSDVEVLVEVELAFTVPLAVGMGWGEPSSRVKDVEELWEGEAAAGSKLAEALATAMVVAKFSISPLRLLV